MGQNLPLRRAAPRKSADIRQTIALYAGTVPETKNAGTQGRPMAGFTVY